MLILRGTVSFNFLRSITGKTYQFVFFVPFSMTYGSLSSDYCTLWLLEAMVLEMVDIIPNLKVIHYITFLTPRQNLTGGKVEKDYSDLHES